MNRIGFQINNEDDENIYEVFDKFFECDYILHPEVLLGYHGYTKPDREGLNMSDA